MRAPLICPVLQKSSCMNFPNRLELLLYTVLALPSASRMGPLSRIDDSMERLFSLRVRNGNSVSRS